MARRTHPPANAGGSSKKSVPIVTHHVESARLQEESIHVSPPTPYVARLVSRASPLVLPRFDDAGAALARLLRAGRTHDRHPQRADRARLRRPHARRRKPLERRLRLQDGRRREGHRRRARPRARALHDRGVPRFGRVSRGVGRRGGGVAGFPHRLRPPLGDRRRRRRGDPLSAAQVPRLGGMPSSSLPIRSRRCSR